MSFQLHFNKTFHSNIFTEHLWERASEDSMWDVLMRPSLIKTFYQNGILLQLDP